MHHQKDGDGPIPDLVRTAVLPLAAPRTPAPDPGPGPGLTPTLPVAPGLARPTAAHSLVRLTPDGTDAATDDPGPDPGPGPDLTDTDAPVLLAPLRRTEEGPGTLLNPHLPTRDHALAPREDTGAAAREEEEEEDAANPITETCLLMS